MGNPRIVVILSSLPHKRTVLGLSRIANYLANVEKMCYSVFNTCSCTYTLVIDVFSLNIVHSGDCKRSYERFSTQSLLSITCMW